MTYFKEIFFFLLVIIISTEGLVNKVIWILGTRQKLKEWKKKQSKADKLPSQFIIGPGSNPSWQLHSKLPMMFVHVPFPHGLPIEHSSVSVHDEQMQTEENWDTFKFFLNSSITILIIYEICTHRCSVLQCNLSCIPWGTHSGMIHQYWCSDHLSKSLGFQDIHWHLKSRKILATT